MLTAWAVLGAALAILWGRQLVTRNATSVDVAWSAGLACLAATYPWFVDGDPSRRILVGVLGGTWALRLTWHLWTDRVLRHTDEDGRYQALRAHWGAKAPSRFFIFYQMQAAVAVLFSVPMLTAMNGGALGGMAFVGCAVWLVSVTGEAIADRQLARFRADPTNRGAVCKKGLWHYSRHPNYFFEWIHWWTYVLIGGGAILTWIGPTVMLFLLFRVTGIPYVELQATKSRGHAYREYQRTTSVFIPWPPKSRAS